MFTIIYAGFGCWDRTIDVTQLIRNMYWAGNQQFSCTGCKINGVAVDDPAPGTRKYLFVVYWAAGQPPYGSVVTWEGDDSGFSIPFRGG